MYNTPGIPDEYAEIVDKIANEIVNYKNEQKLSWIASYNFILKEMGLEDKINDTLLFHYVIRKITYLKYDIVLDPYFRLERY